MRAKRYSINRNKFLTEVELAQLRSTLARNAGTRDAALLWTLVATGARITEALNLTSADLNHTEQAVFIQGIKDSNDRELPVQPDLFMALTMLSGPRLFNISYTRARQIWDLYRPVKKNLHSLRHTFAIELYKKTRDLRLVQLALGHRNIQNTIVYADYVYSTQELKRLVL